MNMSHGSTTLTLRKQKHSGFHLKEPGSAITHFIGFVFTFAGTFMILPRAAKTGNSLTVLSMTIFIVTMMMLYAASTTYHSLDISPKINKILRKNDHMMISVMIAGSYTPICLLVLKGTTGHILFGLVWGIALLGILIKAFWITCPKWFSSILYIGMGWLCLLAMPQIYATLSTPAFLWLFIGGAFYTVGGIIYGLKLPIFDAKHKNFGSHEIFHLFIMAGSFCHFLLMYEYVIFL